MGYASPSSRLSLPRPLFFQVMRMSTNRQIKDALFDQVARMAVKAVASPKRLELRSNCCVRRPNRWKRWRLKPASASNWSVPISRSCAWHGWVETERQGKHIIYRIASPEVPRFWILLRTLAEDRLFELQDAVRQLSAQ